MKWIKSAHVESPIHQMMQFLDSLNIKYGRTMRDMPMNEIREILDESDMAKFKRALKGDSIDLKPVPKANVELDRDEIKDLIESMSALKNSLSTMRQDRSSARLYVNVERLQLRLMRELREMGNG